MRRQSRGLFSIHVGSVVSGLNWGLYPGYREDARTLLDLRGQHSEHDFMCCIWTGSFFVTRAKSNHGCRGLY
jgi:hypothetical protein